jgi:16S rRNA (cytosine1402-N4)-methyltransferase
MTRAALDAPHLPVLLEEAMSFLCPRDSGLYCDATVGVGGHARAIIERSAPHGRVIGIDRDADVLDLANANLAPHGDRVRLVHAPFSQIRSVLEQAAALPLDGCIADLGVSSVQLDQPERGFSFRRSGPLDMRMDRSHGETAADLLQRVDEEELARLLHDLGEERFARKIARAIIRARENGELTSTGALASLVARSVPGREPHKDPATRVFQALRIAVNDELGELDRFLRAAPGCLRPGGRLVVIAFHSLEDRVVKRRLRALAAGDAAEPGAPRFRVLTKHVITASESELARNPRARSAKLRAAERLLA